MYRLLRRVGLAAVAAASACGAWSIADADEIGVTIKTLEWDPRAPAQTPYQDRAFDAFINTAVQKAWDVSRPGIIKNVVEKVTQPDRIKSGITLYNVDLQLNANAPNPTLHATSDPAAGRIRLFLPNNTMDFTSTYPGVPRKADPQMRASFDLTVDIDIRVNGKLTPPIEVVTAVAQPVNAELRARNFTGGIGLTLDDVISTLTGGNRLRDMITEGINKSSLNLTGDMRAFLASNAGLLAFPAGYAFNGGRIEGRRIVIAAWRMKSLPATNILVTARWDPNTSFGISCDDLRVAITLPHSPAPYGQGADKFFTYAARALDPGGIVPYGSEKACRQFIASVAGVTGNVEYRTVVSQSKPSYHPRTPWSVEAIPENWDNPLLVGQETVAFRLETHSGGIADGVNVLDPGYAAVHSDPIDPVARTRIDPSERMTLPVETHAIPSLHAPTDRASSVALNPQPLPPRDATPAQLDDASQPAGEAQESHAAQESSPASPAQESVGTIDTANSAAISTAPAASAPGSDAGVIVIGGNAARKQPASSEPPVLPDTTR